jgi:hypothetical protein
MAERQVLCNEEAGNLKYWPQLDGFPMYRGVANRLTTWLPTREQKVVLASTD